MVQETWLWVVVYDDGSYHFEDELETFHKVELSKVTQLIVYHFAEEQRQYVIPITQGETIPFFFRRRRKLIDISTGEEFDYLFGTAFGWADAQTLERKCFTWILHDESVVISEIDLDDLV